MLRIYGANSYKPYTYILCFVTHLVRYTVTFEVAAGKPCQAKRKFDTFSLEQAHIYNWQWYSLCIQQETWLASLKHNSSTGQMRKSFMLKLKITIIIQQQQIQNM